MESGFNDRVIADGINDAPDCDRASVRFFTTKWLDAFFKVSPLA